MGHAELAFSAQVWRSVWWLAPLWILSVVAVVFGKGKVRWPLALFIPVSLFSLWLLVVLD
jgi:hypothetical protein